MTIHTLLRSIGILIFLSLTTRAFSQKPVFQGQGPTQVVSTVSKPIQKQWKGEFVFNDGGVVFSNDFKGGRLNGVLQNGSEEFTILISAENIPINSSPWFAFKVRSNTGKKVKVHFNYENARSRYFPKISKDGLNWTPLDSSRFEAHNMGAEAFGPRSAPESITIELDIDSNPTWVCAQELHTTDEVGAWTQKMAESKFTTLEELGKSREGRTMKVLTIGKEKAQKAIMVISRQHPPEVTGYLAMKSFVETISSDSDLSKKFRKKFKTYVVPLMNPDGVDNGHWRHNSGGIDLNRDWSDFNQPETTNVREFMKDKSESGTTYAFGIDFHSTWDDIYYTVDSSFTNNVGGIVYRWLDNIDRDLPNYKPNIRPSKKIVPTLVSRNYFFEEYGMPALVFELGDNTERGFLALKGKVAAENLMLLLLEGN